MARGRSSGAVPRFFCAMLPTCAPISKTIHQVTLVLSSVIRSRKYGQKGRFARFSPSPPLFFSLSVGFHGGRLPATRCEEDCWGAVALPYWSHRSTVSGLWRVTGTISCWGCSCSPASFWPFSNRELELESLPHVKAYFFFPSCPSFYESVVSKDCGVLSHSLYPASSPGCFFS